MQLAGDLDMQLAGDLDMQLAGDLDMQLAGEPNWPALEKCWPKCAAGVPQWLDRMSRGRSEESPRGVQVGEGARGCALLGGHLGVGSDSENPTNCRADYRLDGLARPRPTTNRVHALRHASADAKGTALVACHDGFGAF